MHKKRPAISSSWFSAISNLIIWGNTIWKVLVMDYITGKRKMDGALRYQQDIHLLISFMGHHLAYALWRKLRVMNEMFLVWIEKPKKVVESALHFDERPVMKKVR